MALRVAFFLPESESGVIHLHLGTALHHVLERAQLFCVCSATRAKVRVHAWPVFGDGLRPKTTSLIICLVFVELLCLALKSAWLGQSPSGHVLLVRGQSTCFRHITTGSDSCWRRSFVLQPTITTSKSKRVKGSFLELWALFWKVLRTWVLLQIAWLHLNILKKFKIEWSYSGFSSNLGNTSVGFAI